MYVVSARGVWNDNNTPGTSYISYTRIKEWKYTGKGWFCYELCVPEYPEVTEMVDGSCLIRVKPMTEEQREMSENACVVWGIREITSYVLIGIQSIWKNWIIMGCMNICMQ